MRRVLVSRLSLLGLLLVAFALRVYRLGYQELRGDEAFGYFLSRYSYADIVRRTLSLQEPHPVAAYFVSRAWMAWAGDSEFALRFVGLCWSVLAVALLYRMACALGLSRAVGMLGAALLALSPYAIWHSQDARMYNMSLALTLASTWLALEAVRRPRWRYWCAYILVSWLALHTHYFAAFILVAQNVFFLGQALLVAHTRRHVWQWLVAQAAIVVLYLPWLSAARSILTTYGGNMDSPTFGAALQRTLSVFVAGESGLTQVRVLAAGICGVVMLIGLTRLLVGDARTRQAAALLVLYLAVPVMATWLSSRNRPIFNERYLVAAVPACYLLLAAAISPIHSVRRAALWQGLKALGIAGLTVLLFGASISLYRYYTDPAYSKTLGWRELARAVDRFSAGLPVDQVRVAENFPDPTLWYYYRGSVDHLVLPPAGRDQAGTQREVRGLVDQGVRRVILPLKSMPWWDNADIAATVLAQEYTLIDEKPVGAWQVQVYTRPSQELMPVGTAFKEGPILAAAAVEPTELPAGGLLAVHTRWAGSRDGLTGSEKITVQVLDAQNKLVAQRDEGFVPAAVGGPPVTYGILLPQEASPGTYRVIAVLYRPEQVGPGRLLTSDGSDFVSLATIHIR